jgi:tRNA nucleotidyltransferase (CCA-adding enzyme)
MPVMRRDLCERIPAPVMSVARRLREAGHPVYVVGGALRDLLLGREPCDWDLATPARPEEMRPLFAGWRVMEVGARHGTLGVVPPAAPGVRAPTVVQVTTFRTEGPYRDFRHPEYVRFVADLYQDLSRRDFTVNALALDPFTGELHDPYGGQGDMQRGLIRAVGNAESRFREDAIRPLRAFRLVSEYGWEIEAATAQAIANCAPLLERVARERVRVELEHILGGPHAGKALRLMAAHGLLQRVFPGVEPSAVPWDAIDRCPARLELRLVLLLEGMAGGGTAAAEGWLARWRFPSRVAQRFRALVVHRPDRSLLEADPGRLRRWIGSAGRDLIPDLVELARARWPERGEELARRVRAELERGVPAGVEELPLSGHDVMAVLNLPPGPRVGQILRELLQMVWDDPSLNDRAALLELLRRRYGAPSCKFPGH